MPSVCNNGRKQLVKSQGDLYCVVRFMARSLATSGEVIDFRVYKLVETGGTRWIGTEDLGDRALFLGEFCSFFVSTSECSLFGKNCIYYLDDFLAWRKENTGELVGSRENYMAVFNLKDRRSGNLADDLPGFAQMLWPRPPAWFVADSSDNKS